MNFRLSVLCGIAIAELISSSGALATECADVLLRVQTQVSDMIAREAGNGVSGKETAFATLSRQPTPESLARAEQSLGEGKDFERALMHLRVGHALEAKGDRDGCLAEVLAAKEALR